MVVFGMVVVATQFAYRWGSATPRVMAELKASLTVGREVLPNVFPAGRPCSVKSQERVGFLAF